VRRSRTLICAALLLAATAACSPGTLPGAASPVLIGGGGARYNGTITYRRVGSVPFSFTEAQGLSLSISMRGDDQIFGRFETPESSGSISGTVNGSLASGTFDATVLVSSAAGGAGGTVTCEGEGRISGTFSGVNLSWSGGTIQYSNCPGLLVTSSVQAIAISPIPGAFGTRANVVIAVLGGTSIARGTCPGGVPGYPFTVEMAEHSGVSVTFDPTFDTADESGSRTTLDMPFRDLAGGSRRTYSVCSPSPGTYQAFFSGTDANGNGLRVASPIVTFVP
jgi:hypothetical protein